MATAGRVRERDGSLTLVAAALLALAALAWVLSARRMSGMDMGPGTALGGLGWFAVTWLLMMAAMMLPALFPAASASREAPGFTAGYIAAWVGAGLVASAGFEAIRSAHIGWLAWDRGGRWVAAGVILVAAAYQLTTAKGACLDRCRAPAVGLGGLRDGLRHGANCVACCVGLIAALFALGVMSLAWMAVVAVLIAAERLLPWRTPAVYAVAATLALLGIWLAVDPGSLPGLTVPGAMAAM